MSQENKDIWSDRWSALADTMDSMIEQYTDLSNPTYKTLVSCLRAFGEKHFLFFYEGFNTNRLRQSLPYPKEYVLRSILDQVAFDISIIRRCVSQHQQGTAEMKQTLAKGDALVQDALNLATEAKCIKDTVALTYFDKSAKIRVLPYAPVALIGIPYTTTTVKRDYLAIPHEVGHYVYWHSGYLASDYRASVPFKPTWLWQWLEEIFADVYGCLVAGPVIGVDFQDLLLDELRDDFIKDDGVHPLDAIRPEIYERALQELGFSNTSKALSKRWQQCLKKRGTPTEFVPSGEQQAVLFEDAIPKMLVAVDQARQTLNPLHEVRENNSSGYWSQDLGNGKSPETLYDDFKKWLKESPTVHINQLQEQDNKVGVSTQNAGLENTRQKGETNTWLDSMMQNVSGSGGVRLDPAAWLPIFRAVGWTVKGPEDVCDPR
jgi:hypothetical protein